MTINQIQKEAPEGATHYNKCPIDGVIYWKVENGKAKVHLSSMFNKWSSGSSDVVRGIFSTYVHDREINVKQIIKPLY